MTDAVAAISDDGARLATEEVRDLSDLDMDDLISAAHDAIALDGGFGWLRPPAHSIMRQYWRGVLLIPERRLFVARLDDTICGSVQLHFSSAQNEAQRLVGRLSTFFIAPWARGRGLGSRLLVHAEATARESGLLALELNLRATQERARQTFEARGYKNWGINPHYARIEGRWVSGYSYSLSLIDGEGEDGGDGDGGGDSHGDGDGDDEGGGER
ncbi:MAG: GNAT family N-acetyltransferase [Alphaproteobacteria bacterium]|nr:GNAT family N-acetyltransferase [Alphaproteobacteria bacterium]MDA7987594.1 GNAT family N-acetyltransferase [Alphaproteobacteria bacterium]MDA8000718.1 GNAT family N-acetyltransferase [Alphaproteobacteria bacterium]MDA8004223.1 GNAT family N-acetyltransferase [Alphaproteobacteria bacterium]MDA8005997.1 GNAT family N-acetyltransferase [Alphaproteobacteria bacterium]